MNNSQSSDFFDESGDISCGSPKLISDEVDDGLSHDDLISKTKFALSGGFRKELKKPTFYNYILSLLDDCGKCISQSLDLIISTLSETTIAVDVLVEHLMDAVSILQMLSECIKTVIEVAVMSCCRIQNFPTATSRILMIVFMHCRDSEELYGNVLKNVENQLKDLFRACHELQLTYLMVFEKNFAFDLDEREHLLILFDALEINLKIGELVQTLDIKTMAEQWKGLIAVYEKYSNALIDTNIFNNCTAVLCGMIENNLKTALQANQDEKSILRSLKVTGFTLKILVKICIIFRLASVKKHQHLVDLLIFIVMNCNTSSENSERDNNTINTYVLNPTETLLNELMLDENFNNTILNCNIENLLRERKLPGFVLLLTYLMKTIIHKNNTKISKKRIIECVYCFLPYCQTIVKHSRSMYEDLLVKMTALIMIMDNEEFDFLERRMLEAILSTECFSALFSSNLWSLMARIVPGQLLLNQIVSLCEIYEELQSNILFLYSPQRIHLSFTIRNLFEAMNNEDKLKLYKQFSAQNEKNVRILAVLGVENLPATLRSKVEDDVLDKVMEIQKDIDNGTGLVDVDKLISTMNLAATCTHKIDRRILEFITRGWERVCPENNDILQSKLNTGSLWYLQYLEALMSMTSTESLSRYQSSLTGKILHAISGLIETNNEEYQILLIDFMCRLASVDVQDDYKFIENMLEKFRALLKDSTKAKIALKKLRHLQNNKNVDRILRKLIREDPSLGIFLKTEIDDHILLTNNVTFHHKCVQNTDVPLKSSKKTCSGNFDLADIDTMFENESESQPVCKKAKLNYSEADVIISRLENDVSALCSIKKNIFTRHQLSEIKNICDKLQNILEC
ncbi:uncharacterized protein C1orf112 homolog [Bombyx mandarina]|uniref:Uncharacterized protein C1orf112 homolog n=1 Tax=Bombyx mandarina TaxID=7092 RepID=A0A6J2KSQ9_BOMMA|nr:uncharacterized protein C1orf112 homolog [Bombyx mandarina]